MAETSIQAAGWPIGDTVSDELRVGEPGRMSPDRAMAYRVQDPEVS